MLEVKQFVFNHFEENTYLLVDSATKNCAVVDPGMLSEAECLTFDKYITENKLILTQIILTHGHLDHCFGVDHVKNAYGAPVKGHPGDARLLAELPAQARQFGLLNRVNQPLGIDVALSDGDTIDIGESSVIVLHVPGHSPGGIALYNPEGGWVISGDSLFRGSIGRTDLAGGDTDTLINAVKEQLLALPADTVVLPGHGPYTTIRNEKVSNPFLS